MDNNYQCLLTEKDGSGVLQITLHRPDKLNALNQQMLMELNHIIDEAQENPEIKALLLTGHGKAFCAGADIKKLAELNAQQGLKFARLGQNIFRKLEQLTKPVIAAINGYAFGGGCELAMSAHIRIASDAALFGQPEVKLGVIPGYGGTQRLARLVGKGRALDLCLTGRNIDAKTALQWGLVTHLSDSENLISEAKKLTDAILKLGPCAVTSVLKTIDSGFDMSLDDALDLEAVHFSLCCATKDKQEGVEAFLNKRQAQFTGE